MSHCALVSGGVKPATASTHAATTDDASCFRSGGSTGPRRARGDRTHARARAASVDERWNRSPSAAGPPGRMSQRSPSSNATTCARSVRAMLLPEPFVPAVRAWSGGESCRGTRDRTGEALASAAGQRAPNSSTHGRLSERPTESSRENGPPRSPHLLAPAGVWRQNEPEPRQERVKGPCAQGRSRSEIDPWPTFSH